MTTVLERAATQLTSCFVPQAAHRAAAAAIAEAATLRAEKEQLEKTLTQVRTRSVLAARRLEAR